MHVLVDVCSLVSMYLGYISEHINTCTHTYFCAYTRTYADVDVHVCTSVNSFYTQNTHLRTGRTKENPFCCRSGSTSFSFQFRWRSKRCFVELECVRQGSMWLVRNWMPGIKSHQHVRSKFSSCYQQFHVSGLSSYLVSSGPSPNTSLTQCYVVLYSHYNVWFKNGKAGMKDMVKQEWSHL